MVAKPRSSYARVSKLFFDEQRVIRGMDAATRKALSQWGAFVRKDARNSLVKASPKTRPSTPPAPPRSRTGKLKQGIFFYYDARSRNVIIGPVRFARSRADNLEMLEYGGRRTQLMPDIPTRMRFQSGKRKRRGVLRDARGRYLKQQPEDVAARTTGKVKMVRQVATYQERPFMRPAREINLPKAAQCFKDSLV
jgi:hypothetical protein